MNQAPAIKRINALILDGIFLALFIYILLPLLLPKALPDSNIRGPIGAGLLLIVFAYEPFMVRYFGATLGHKVFGLCVKNTNGSRLTMTQAVARTLIKGFIGIFSFITFFKSGKAIHDHLTNTCVYFKS